MAATTAPPEDAPFDAVALFIFCALAALLSLMAAAFTEDPLFRLHAYVLTVAFVLASSVMTVGFSSGRFRASRTR
ncbi:MAG: cytochrome-c oxidase, cbb3-type subunit I, partial [Phenylobacterium sp.]